MDYVGDWQTDESYNYDQNGNRTTDITNFEGTSDYTTGEDNQLTGDGTYNYTYDKEGNRTHRYIDHDSSGDLSSYDHSVTKYEWDHRNRLVKVTNPHGETYSYDTVEYEYDAFNQLVSRKYVNQYGTVEHQTAFVHNNGQIVLQFDKQGTGDLAAA